MWFKNREEKRQTNTVDGPRPVTGDVKRPKYVWLANHKRLVILVSIVLVVVIFGSYLFVKYNRSSESTDTTKTPVVTYQGEEYEATYLTADDQTKYNDRVYSIDENIAQAEQSVAGGNTTYEAYIKLAELYLIKGDKTNAAKNYKLARTKLDPSSPWYTSLQQSIDDELKQLGENTND